MQSQYLFARRLLGLITLFVVVSAIATQLGLLIWEFLNPVAGF